MKKGSNCIILFLRWFIGVMLRLVYRLNKIGVDNIPETGALLFVGNHVSFLDALVVYCTSKRPVRFIADEAFLPLKNPLCRYVIKQVGVIKFNPQDRRSNLEMIKEARRALQNGDAVAIFAEGGLTRDAQVRGFKRGFLGILRKNPNVPILPFSIAGFYGSRWAYAGKGVNYKRPPYRAVITYGQPFDYAEALAQGETDEQVAQRLLHIVQEQLVDSIDYRKHPENVYLLAPTREAIRSLHIQKKELRLADSTGKETTSYQTLLQILVLRRALRRIIRNEKFVGVLLPTSVSGVLVNQAISFNNRIPVNLNYTFTNEVNNYCIKKVGISKILTSSKLLKKLPNLQLDAELLSLEDFAKTGLKISDKIFGLVESFLPSCLLERILGISKQKLSDINTIVFTSGSTGMPKGVILTNGNVSANTQSFMQSAMPRKNERILGTLPFFHSFGYTVTCWFPIIRAYPCIYHYNPLDFRGVAEVAKKYHPTILISTPTFLRSYLRKCSKEDFASLDFSVPGAEKTPKELMEGWRQKFGYSLNEGFGATELSPVLSHNIPEHLAPDTITPYHKDGSIGRAGAGFVAKVVDMTTGKEMPPNESGMLLVKGNSVTEGYFQDPEKTSKIFRDGWYVTGDIAKIDEHNFIFITGRETRISKIGGEMAPHTLIEERLIETIKELVKENREKNPSSEGSTNEDDLDDSYQLVITAVPDPKKGEKLVALCVNLPVSPADVCSRLLETQRLPQLWIPALPNFRDVDAIPVLGTGKLDLKAIKELALKLYGIEAE